MSKPQLKFEFTAKQIIKEKRVTQKDIDSIRHWVKKQNRIPKLTDEQIVLFLLSCDNDYDAAICTIKAFYHVRKSSPDLFDRRRLERADLRKQLKTGQFCVLPQRTEDNCIILVYKFVDTYYGNFEMAPFLTLMFMTLDAALYEHPPKGLIFLYDIKGMGLMHLTRLRVGFLKSYFYYLQEGLPVKLKKMHILNSVYFIDKIMKLIKPFAKQEVLELMNFHKSDMNMEEFYEKCIPRKCLPQDYGGYLPFVQELHERNIERLDELQSYFDAEEIQRHEVN